MIKVEKNNTSIEDLTKKQLLIETLQHIGEVKDGITFLTEILSSAADIHDEDKISDIDGFYDNLKSKFQKRNWLDNHYKISRHHIMQNNVDDVNLLDVLEHIVDCLVAGYARSNKPYPPTLSDKILQKAFNNTVKLIEKEIV